MKKITEVFFDVETKKFFDDINLRDPSLLGVSLVSVYKRVLNENLEEEEGTMQSFWEEELYKMWSLFEDANRIVGFNSVKFDVPALKLYAPTHFSKLPHFDIIQEVKKVIGRRISLNAIAKDTLGRGKIDSGENAILYYQKGDTKSQNLLKKYCEEDVRLTKDVYDHVLKNKQLRFTDHWNTPRTIEIDFSYPEEEKKSPQIGLF